MLTFKSIAGSDQHIEILNEKGEMVGTIESIDGEIRIVSARFKDAETQVGPFTNSVTFEQGNSEIIAPSMTVRFQ